MMQLSDNRGYRHFAGLHGVPNWYCWLGYDDAAAQAAVAVGGTG